jgi:hypothetical protein
MRADKGATQVRGRVSRWDDQSPAKMRATQDVESLQPLLVSDGVNGKPAVEFDGIDDFLQLGSGFSDYSLGNSMFGIFESNSEEGCTAMFEVSNGSEVDDISFGRSGTQLNYEVLQSIDQNAAFPSNVPVEFSIIHHADETVEIRKNGLFGSRSQFALPVSIERLAAYVGKTLYANCPSYAGRIGEILVYNRELSSDEVQAVEKYLRDKYECCAQ